MKEWEGGRGNGGGRGVDREFLLQISTQRRGRR